jgi:hypothetical protein
MRDAIYIEKTIRTARDRLEQWVGSENRSTCLGIYLLEEILDSVESATAAEMSDLLSIPPEPPKRDWCRGCKGCR